MNKCSECGTNYSAEEGHYACPYCVTIHNRARTCACGAKAEWIHAKSNAAICAPCMANNIAKGMNAEVQQ